MSVPTLNLNMGKSSSAVANSGGATLQEYLNSKYKKGIKEGDIAESVPGNLNCTNSVSYYIWKEGQHSKRDRVMYNSFVKNTTSTLVSDIRAASKQ